MPHTTPDLKAHAQQVLTAIAGPDAVLREDQWQAIHALVAKRQRALVVQRTGWGKSAVYFIATALLRAAGSGPTLIVSPLLALMRNQLAAAERAGLRAITINSTNQLDWENATQAIADDAVDLLLISPERLNNPDFRDNSLPTLAKTTGLLVVDEAHCISDWGHDFRPDYRRIRQILSTLPSDIPVLATTATANDRVVADIHEQLSADLTLRGTLDRESLRLSVLSLPSHSATLAWLAEHLPELPGSGIIYTLTVSAAEELAAFLTEQGFPVSAYTGKTEATEREATEADLINNDVKALVATSALGMGFDKPDLGFVIHVGAPSSPVAYYQQIGRAGRGVERAEVLLLPSKADQDIWSYFDGLSFPKQHIVEQLLDVLNDAGRPLSIPAIEPHVELSRSRIEATLKVLDVDGAVSRSKSGWSATGQGWTYDAKRYANLSAARTHEQQLMLEYQQIPGCRMEFLRRTLDDPEAAPCGRCDNCTGTRRSDKVSADRITSARTSLDKPGVTIVARRMWPTGLEGIGIPLKGKISASAQPEDGKTVGRLTDIAWGNQLRQLFRDQGPEVVASADLVKASIRVLAEWQWKARPVGIVFIESASRPELSRDLAHQLSTIGRLPMLGSVHSFGGTVSNVNSAQRLAAVYRNLSLSHETIKAVQAAPGPILLIDDLIDSGWTMTVATHLLRQHCDVPILPFALASTN